MPYDEDAATDKVIEGSEGVGEPEEAQDTLSVTVWSVPESSDLSSSSSDEKVMEAISRGRVLDVASLGVSQPWCGESERG